MRRRTAVASALTCLGMAAASVVAPTVASAQTQPTAASLEARSGPLQTRSETIRGASGFGGGRIHYPTTPGKYGVVAVSPGFTASESTIRWFGPRIASHGFVVVTIETNTRMDQPPQRGRQLLAALDWATQRSSVTDRIDPTKLAVGGHSMGGGGSLTAAMENPEIDATFPLTAWHMSKNWSRLRTPSLIVAAENDMIAPVGQHAKPFYNSLAGPKAYIEWRGADHLIPNRNNDVMLGHTVAWLKRFVDGDTSMDAYLCGGSQSNNRDLSAYEASCPFPGAGAPGAGGGTPAPLPAVAPAPAPAGGFGGLGGGLAGGLGGLGGGSLGGLGGGGLGSLFGGGSGMFSSLFSGFGGGSSSLFGGMFGM